MSKRTWPRRGFTYIRHARNNYDNQYSAVDILCRPGPYTVLTSEEEDCLVAYTEA